jgi:hypothetical protein
MIFKEAGHAPLFGDGLMPAPTHFLFDVMVLNIGRMNEDV